MQKFIARLTILILIVPLLAACDSQGPEKEGIDNPVTDSPGGQDPGTGSGGSVGDNSDGGDAGGDNSGSPSTIKLVIQNELAVRANIYINGQVVGSIGPYTTAEYDTGNLDSLKFSWSLVRPKTSSGLPLGESFGGIFTTIYTPAGTINFEIDNDVSGTTYFTPLISNETNYELLMAVNWGLMAEHRCNCVVPAGSQSVHIGYYRYFGNSNVVGFTNTSGYTGTFYEWKNISIDNGSGVARLVAVQSGNATQQDPTPESVAPSWQEIGKKAIDDDIFWLPAER